MSLKIIKSNSNQINLNLKCIFTKFIMLTCMLIGMCEAVSITHSLALGGRHTTKKANQGQAQHKPQLMRTNWSNKQDSTASMSPSYLDSKVKLLLLLLTLISRPPRLKPAKEWTSRISHGETWRTSAVTRLWPWTVTSSNCSSQRGTFLISTETSSLLTPARLYRSWWRGKLKWLERNVRYSMEGLGEKSISSVSVVLTLKPSQSTAGWTAETGTAGARRASALPGGNLATPQSQWDLILSCRRLRRSCCSLCCSDDCCAGCRSCLCRAGPVRGQYDGLVVLTCLVTRTLPRHLLDKLRNSNLCH